MLTFTEMGEILRSLASYENTILTFDNVANPYHVDQIFSHDKPQDMVDFLKNIK